MENKEFYYAKGDDNVGPIFLDELKTLELSDDTLIWYDGIANWTELKNIPELYPILNIKKTPPPLPKKQSITKTEVSGELKVHTEKKQNDIFEKIKPTQRVLRIFLIWSGVNIFALITSYSKIDFFSKDLPRTDKFWPFVKIFQFHDIPNSWPGLFKDRPEAYWEYNGLFYRYDWSEFLIYVIGAVLIFIIIKLSNNDQLKTL